jgi:5-hydroxyisourate hydrolase-like protein (transthyretin family)
MAKRRHYPAGKMISVKQNIGACLLILGSTLTPLQAAGNQPTGIQQFSIEALQNNPANVVVDDGTLKTPAIDKPLIPTDTAAYVQLDTLLEGRLAIPDTLKNAPVNGIEKINGVLFGKTMLNGLDTLIAIYTPKGADKPNLAIAHKRLLLRDYIPDIEGTALGRQGYFNNAVWLFVPEQNKELVPTTSSGKLLANRLGNINIKSHKPASDINLLADTSLNEFQDGPAIAAIMQLDSKSTISLDTTVNARLFTNVRASNQPATPIFPSHKRTLEGLKSVYGAQLVSGVHLIAPANQLVGKRLGPARIASAAWDITLGIESTTIGMVLNLDMPVAKTNETLQARDVAIEFDINKRQLSLSGKIARDKAEKLVKLDDLTLSRADFEGELTLKEGKTNLATPQSYQNFDLKIDGNGTAPSKTRSNTPVNLHIALNLDNTGESIVPTLIIEGGLRLSDLLGKSLVSKIADPQLNQVKISTDAQSGWGELHGMQVQIIRYQAEGDAYPIIGMHHETLDLGTYIPKIRNTSLGSFGLANASFLILPENTETDITYNELADVPESLQPIVDTSIPGMFPLKLLAGVNVIGLYGTADDGGNAATVMKAYGVDEQGYVVKGNFKASQLRNATLGKTDIPNPIKGNEKAICNAVTSADVTGLDISFPIPGFQPPYTGKTFTFNNSHFSLKEIDGQLEPSILTGMNITLPEAKIGIKSLNMAGKFSVQGNLNQLCNKVTKESDLKVSYAASTAFNTTAVSDIAFAALERVTTREQDKEKADEESSSESNEATEDAQAEDTAITDAIEESSQPSLGWKKAFGLPFLEIRQFASSGTFEQKSGEQSLSWEVWTDSQVGSETLDMHGSMDVKINETSLDIESWSFRLPGPVNVGGLPGLKEIPKANELVLYDIDLSRETMSGRIEWPKQQVSGSAYLAISEDDQQQPEFELFARLDMFALDMMRPSTSNTDGIPDVTGMPNSIWQQNIGPVVMGLRNKDRETLALDDDTPEKLLELFTGRENANIQNQRIKLLDKGDNLLLAKGISLVGVFDASEIQNQTIRNAILDLGLTDSIPLTGAIEKDGNNKFQAQLTASTPLIKPSSSIDFLGVIPSFGDTRLLISTLDEGQFGIESNANITLGQENIAMTGLLSLKPDESGKLVKDDWLFRAPGPINIGGLPGMAELPKFNQMTLLDIELTPNEMTGLIDWPQQQTSGRAWFTRNKNNELSLFARLDQFYPNMLLEGIPNPIGNKTVSPALIAWRTEDREDLIFNEETPARLATILGGDSNAAEPYRRKPLLFQEDTITLANGLTTVSRTDIEELKKIQTINLMLQRVRINDSGLLLTSAFEKDADDKFIAKVTATLSEFEIKDIPSTTIKFRNTQLELSNLEEQKVTLRTHADVTPPLPIKLTIPMNGTMEFEHGTQSDKLSYNLTVPTTLEKKPKISTPDIWTNPPALPAMQIANPGFEGSIEYKPVQTVYECAITGDAKIDSLELEIKVDICNGRELSLVLNDPNSDPVLYIEDEIRLSQLLKGVTKFAKKQSSDEEKKRQLAELNRLLAYIGDVAMSKILISKNAISGHVDLNLGGKLSIKGRASLARDDSSQWALFIRSNETVAISELLPGNLAPLDQFVIPEGLFIVSTKATDDFDLDNLPIKIFDEMFAGLLEKDKAAKIRVSDGLTFLTRSNTSELPPGIDQIASTFGIDGDFIMGGSLGGVFERKKSIASIAMYIALSDVDAPLPDFAGEIIEIKDANAELFMKMDGPGQATEVGISTDAILKMPRLDTPGTRESIDTTISVAYTVGGNDAGSVEIAAEVKGEWKDPLGLEDFELTNTSVGIGVGTSGTTISIHSEEAVFKEKRFVMDLDSAWAGGVPTQLAVQFAKSANHKGDLILDPLIQVELVNSIFKVALKGGSALSNSIKGKLDNINLLIDGVPGPTGDPTTTLMNSISAFTTFSEKLANTSDGALGIMKKSPLGMIGIKNPQIFFVTPGDSLPPREGIDRPPLGLGLVSEGELVLHAGDLKADIAEGEYKINLRDGYLASGTITPPAPFKDSTLTVTGKQSLLTLSPTALRLEGNLELPGSLIPGVPASINGWFDFSREDFDAATQVASGLSIAGGAVNRSASITVKDRTLDIYSSPNGCIDYPVKVDGSITINGPGDVTRILTTPNMVSLDLPVPNPTTCPESLLAMWNTAINTAEEYINDPSKLVDTPTEAQQAMIDAGKAVIDQLPDNEVTRNMYKGVEAVEDALNTLPGAGNIPGAGKVGEGAKAAVDLAKKVPGADLAAQAASEAAARATKAASEAANRALSAIGGDVAGKLVGKVGGEALNALSDAGNLAAEGIGAIGNLFGSGRNYCNVLIENMRDDNIAPESVERARQLWMPFQPVWEASKEAEVILSVIHDETGKIRSTQDSFLYMSQEWNKVALRISPDVPLWNQPVFTYHTNSTTAGKNKPPITPDTWFLKTYDLRSALLKRSLKIYRKSSPNSFTVEETLAALKNWQETSNFDPNADYPGFRCQKQWALAQSMLAAFSLGIDAPATSAAGVATDYISYKDLHDTFAKVYNLGASMRASNQQDIQALTNMQVKAIERNIQFIADLTGKMKAAVKIQKAKAEQDETLAKWLNPPIAEAEIAIDNLYDYALPLAESGANGTQNARLKRLVDTAVSTAGETYSAEINAQREQLSSGTWASKDAQSMIIFPLVKQCLRSFYRPGDNSNPLFVSDCEPNIVKILEDIDNGVARNAEDWKRYMQDSFYDAAKCKRDGYTESLEKLRQCPHKRSIVDLRWQFWLWNAEQPGTVRMATAQSEQSPLATYCLGIPAAFAPSFGDVTVEATPCVTNDKAQLWRKLTDESGQGNFRLQNVKYGICATWSGVSGVNAMILKPCIESLRSNQVVTAGWPLRDAPKQPTVLPEDRQRTYVWKNFDNGRCLRFHEANNNNFTVTARTISDWACAQSKSGGASEQGFRFVPQQTDDGNWRFTVEHNNKTSCLVSTAGKNAYLFGASGAKSGRDSFRTVELGNCDNPRSLWIINGSGIKGESDQRKYQFQEAAGEKLCMTVYEVLQTSSSFYDLPILLRKCESKQPQNEKQLFYALEVDTNFNSKNNRDIINWRQQEIADIRPISGNVRIQAKDSDATRPAADFQVYLVDKKASRRVAATRTDSDGNYRFALLRNDPRIPIEEEVDPSLKVVIREGKEYKVTVRDDIVEDRKRGYIQIGTRPRGDRYTIVVRLDERDTSQGYSAYDESDDNPDGRLNINIGQGKSSSGNNFILKQGMSIGGYTMRLSPNGTVPLAGVELTLSDGNPATADPVTTSSDEGKYEFKFVLPGQYDVIARIDGYRVYGEGYSRSGERGKTARERDGIITTKIGLGSDWNLNDFVFERDVLSISGKVSYDVPYGKGWAPLANATLTLDDGDTATTDPKAITGKNGIYIFEDIQPGTYTIIETNPDHYVSVRDSDGENDDRITVTPGNANLSGNDFTDALIVSIHGNVKHVSPDKKNNPKRNVTVELKGSTKYNSDFIRRTKTDSNGNYRFNDIPFGIYKITQKLGAGEEPYTRYRYRESYSVNVGHSYDSDEYEVNFQSVTPWWK